ncbi:MAG: glucose-6-phosphate isomerase family protein [Nanoarchaeota archaeon]
MNYKKTIGKIEEYGEKKTRKLSDLKDNFKDKKELREILEKRNPVIYETFTKSFSPINLTLTVVNPGDFHGEFYLTKGHVHKKKTPEFYVLLEGSGNLFIQKGIIIKTIEMKKGEIALIPQGYAHRIINTGKNKLKVLSIYHENSMPDYNVKFKRRFFR